MADQTIVQQWLTTPGLKPWMEPIVAETFEEPPNIFALYALAGGLSLLEATLILHPDKHGKVIDQWDNYPRWFKTALRANAYLDGLEQARNLADVASMRGLVDTRIQQVLDDMAADDADSS